MPVYGGATVILALVAMMVESANLPLRLSRYDGPPPAARWLAGREGAVVYVPMGDVDTRALLASLEADCPDLLLLGWELPGPAGADLLSAVRRTCPNLIVIALSGRAGARAAALSAGANGFASKVDPPERLLAIIRSIERR